MYFIKPITWLSYVPCKLTKLWISQYIFFGGKKVSIRHRWNYVNSERIYQKLWMLNIPLVLLSAYITLISQKAVADLLKNIFDLFDILNCVKLTVALECWSLCLWEIRSREGNGMWIVSPLNYFFLSFSLISNLIHFNVNSKMN